MCLHIKDCGCDSSGSPTSLLTFSKHIKIKNSIPSSHLTVTSKIFTNLPV